MADAPINPRCFLCGRNHPLKFCLTFRKMLFSERRNALIGQDVCLNCFGYGHKRDTCPSNGRCQVCRANHHSMIHRPRWERDSSADESSDGSFVSAVSRTEERPDLRSDYEKLPFILQMLTFEDARPIDWQPPRKPNIEVVPVVQCVLRNGALQVSATMLVSPLVPKSHLVYPNTVELFHKNPLTSDPAYKKLDVLHPEGPLELTFALVRDLHFYVPPAIQQDDLLEVTEGRKLAHPEPHQYRQIDGVFGRDYSDRILRGSLMTAPQNPNVTMHDTTFGIVLSGHFVKGPVPIASSIWNWGLAELITFPPPKDHL